MKTIKYYCDICKKEITTPKDSVELLLPTVYIDGFDEERISCKAIDVCKSCALEIAKRLEEFI